MYICKVQGKCISTIKNKGLQGLSLVGVQKINKTGDVSGEIMVVVDPIGCSVGETVLVTTGSNARHALNDSSATVDAVIIGIIDSYDFNQMEE